MIRIENNFVKHNNSSSVPNSVPDSRAHSIFNSFNFSILHLKLFSLSLLAMQSPAGVSAPNFSPTEIHNCTYDNYDMNNENVMKT